MKKIISLIVAGCMLLLAGAAIADQFNVSVNIPAANSANFLVFKITDPNNFPTTPIATTNLTFSMKPPNALNTFLANEYYAINVQSVNGAGLVNLKVNYSDLSKPTGQTDGLGLRGTVTVASVDPNNPAGESNLLKKSLAASDNQTVLASAVPAGQYMRVYVATANGLEDAAIGVIPFTTGDKPGDYTGTLTLTATQP